MLIIFGSKTIGTSIQKGVFSCPYCRVERNYLLKRYKKYFALFFIPLIPLENKGNLVECQSCKKLFVPESALTENEYFTQNQVFTDEKGNGFEPAAPIKRMVAYLIDMIILLILDFFYNHTYYEVSGHSRKSLLQLFNILASLLFSV